MGGYSPELEIFPPPLKLNSSSSSITTLGEEARTNNLMTNRKEDGALLHTNSQGFRTIVPNE
jgi:hypothetical protein